jgi:uncharacterized protein (DUF924 family)
LDQFARNMFRGSPRMFAEDERALRAATDGIEAGVDRMLRFSERTFLYMPLMHSEDLTKQKLCVQLFERLVEEHTGELRKIATENLRYAVAHRDIVERWGRFPHRNAVLDRTSTSDEIEFLKSPGSSF